MMARPSARARGYTSEWDIRARRFRNVDLSREKARRFPNSHASNPVILTSSPDSLLGRRHARQTSPISRQFSSIHRAGISI
jgi:hypothetical protein